MEAFVANNPFMTVVPLLVMLILVVLTKRVFEPILIAIAFVYILKDGWSAMDDNFIIGIIDGIYDVFGDPEATYPWIVLMLSLFGGLIAVLIRSGGISGFKRFATRYIKSERSSLLVTWGLGMILFVDDYINNLAIGPTVRNITDTHKVPREQLGFSICCTGTPECALVPITAFAVFTYEAIMVGEGVSASGSNMITEYVKIIPFLFYPIVIILISLFLALGVLPRVGAFKRYYKELQDGTYALTDAEKAMVGETEDEIEIDESKGNILDFLLPVIILVVIMLITSDLVLSVIFALILAFLMYVIRKKMTIGEFFESFFSGIGDMIFILVVVLMTFVFVEGLNSLGFSEYVIDVVSPMLSGGAIPALTFITVGVIAFLGVDYWAVMLLIAPVAIPLSEQFAVSPYMTVAAIVSGSVFGGTACFFAEQILMCSQAVQRPPVKVAIGGLPYSVFGGVIAVGLFLVFGFAL